MRLRSGSEADTMRRANGDQPSPVATPMPELRITIPEALDAKIEAAMPEYLDRKGFLCLLIDQALDTPVTLGVQSAAGTPSTSSSIPKSINSRVSKKEGRKRENYPPEFEAFWKAYQQLPEKSNKQSKPLALAAWKEVVDEYGADELIRAAKLQLEVQHRELQAERPFTVAMPDCFRWLRDECFVALLEGHTAAQPQQQFTYL
jgi:hypothetical protein